MSDDNYQPGYEPEMTDFMEKNPDLVAHMAQAAQTYPSRAKYVNRMWAYFKSFYEEVARMQMNIVEEAMANRNRVMSNPVKGKVTRVTVTNSEQDVEVSVPGWKYTFNGISNIGDRILSVGDDVTISFTEQNLPYIAARYHPPIDMFSGVPRVLTNQIDRNEYFQPSEIETVNVTRTKKTRTKKKKDVELVVGMALSSANGNELVEIRLMDGTHDTAHSAVRILAAPGQRIRTGDLISIDSEGRAKRVMSNRPIIKGMELNDIGNQPLIQSLRPVLDAGDISIRDRFFALPHTGTLFIGGQNIGELDGYPSITIEQENSKVRLREIMTTNLVGHSNHLLEENKSGFIVLSVSITDDRARLVEVFTFTIGSKRDIEEHRRVSDYRVSINMTKMEKDSFHDDDDYTRHISRMLVRHLNEPRYRTPDIETTFDEVKRRPIKKKKDVIENLEVI